MDESVRKVTEEEELQDEAIWNEIFENSGEKEDSRTNVHIDRPYDRRSKEEVPPGKTETRTRGEKRG
jgi:hypothetical protein